MNDYGDKFSNQVIVPEIAMIKCYLDLAEMDQKLYAEFNKKAVNPCTTATISTFGSVAIVVQKIDTSYSACTAFDGKEN